MRNLINKFLSFGKSSNRADEQSQSVLTKGASEVSPIAHAVDDREQQGNSKRRNEQAFELLQQGLHSEARAHLLQSLAIDAHNADAHYMLAQIAQARRESDEAENHYRQAVSLQPEFERAYIDWCSYLIGVNRFADAKEVAARGLQQLSQSLELNFYLGNLYFREGAFSEAIHHFERALLLQPGNPNLIANLVLALQNVGVLYQQQGEFEYALQYFRKAQEIDPANAEILFMLAHTGQLRGDEAAAISLYIASLISDPAQVKAMSNLGTLLSKQGKSTDAIKWITRAGSCAPEDSALRNNLASVLQASGQHEAAIAAFKTALAAEPDRAQTYFGLGTALESVNQMGDAEIAYQTALLLDPAFVEAYCNLGRVLQAKERLEEALAHYRRAAAIQPEFHVAHVNAADVLEHLGRFDEALSECDAVLSVNDKDIGALLNKALVLTCIGKFDDAVACYDRVLQIDPTDERTLTYKANALLNACKLDDAIRCSDELLAINPEHPEAHFIKASAFLCDGDYANGWPEFEYRLALESMQSIQLGNAPVWTGTEDLRNQTILVLAEQGLGDALQFIRYTALLAARHATVHVLVPKPLAALAASCAGVSAVYTSREQIAQVDYQIAMMSLPNALKTTLTNIPAREPYLFAKESDIEKWRARISPASGLRVGLIWSGNPRKDQRGVHRVDRTRSVTFDQLAPILALSGIDFYSLQLGDEAVAQARGNPRIIDLTSHITDFADTAALMMHLDLIISVDTSVAHLAGAVGKPIWLLNRYNTCWRWLLEREDSPWYPSARIFRQRQAGDWTNVIADIKEALGELAAAQHQKH